MLSLDKTGWALLFVHQSPDALYRQMKGELEMDDGKITFVVIALFLVIMLVALVRGVLVDEKVAILSLESQDYSNAKITDHTWFAVGLRGCDSKDAARFTARVTNPAGNVTEVYVCTGWLFKGSTIRTW